MKEPNLFMGTSEATQDAFICWLIDWANPDREAINSELHETGKNLIKAFFKKASKKLEEDITSIQPVTTSRIDIEYIINDKYLLIIEDKIKTKQHSNQLERYFKSAEKKHPEKEIIPIYLKTYEQDDYHEVEKYFKPFLRLDFLEVLNESKEVTNEIFKDFHNHLLDINAKVESYKSTKIDDWKPDAWYGFYSNLKKH